MNNVVDEKIANIINNQKDDSRNTRIITYILVFVVVIISYILIYKFLQNE